MITFDCECGLHMVINCTKEETVEYKCPRCSLPIGRPVEIEDRIALQAMRVCRMMQREND